LPGSGARAVCDAELIQTIEPELSQALRRSIGSIGVAVGEDIERDLTPRTREMAQALADVLVKALAGGLDVQLEHIRQTARDIGREMITEAALSIRDQKEFVGEITHVAMRQACSAPSRAPARSSRPRSPEPGSGHDRPRRARHPQRGRVQRVLVAYRREHEVADDQSPSSLNDFEAGDLKTRSTRAPTSTTSAAGSALPHAAGL